MGDLLHPDPKRWRRTQPVDDVQEDGVIHLATELLRVLQVDVNPTQVQMAALILVAQGVERNYFQCAGFEALEEARFQASQLASLYDVNTKE